jgi:hypothetical protein
LCFFFLQLLCHDHVHQVFTVTLLCR